MSKSEHADELVTIEELAERLQVHVRTIQRIVKRKELRAIRIGRQWRFRREWVEDWLEENTTDKETKDQDTA